MTSESGRVVHSVYADGTRVYVGQQPGRIRGPLSDAAGVGHSVIRFDQVNRRIYQAREYDALGYPVRDLDFTTPTYADGRPRPDHPIPHQHRWIVNDPRIGPPSGFKRGGPEPIESP